ncbi:hypothetical protein CsSME_00024888 [Camellia sinensis var. sinensis]
MEVVSRVLKLARTVIEAFMLQKLFVILEGFFACAVSERILILPGLPRSVAKPRNPLGESEETGAVEHIA